MRLKLFLLIILLGGVVGAFNYAYKSTYPTEECENIFTSGVYPEYQRQLTVFIKQHPLYEQVKAGNTTTFNNTMKSFVEDLEKNENIPDLRTYHVSWVQKLRALIELSGSERDDEKDSHALMEDVVRWIFLDADLQAPIEEFFYTYASPLKGDIFTFLQEARNQLRANTRFDGMQHPSSEEDNFLHGNLPFLLFATSELPSTRIIRMGHPAGNFTGWINSVASPKIHPEFLLFLWLQPSHLYVNLMKRMGMESAGSQAIEELEKQFPNLYVITLDKNSPFYWQDRKHYPEVMGSAAFQDLFFEQMTEENGNYYWSDRLDPLNWTQELKNIMAGVHRDYFANQAELSMTERQDFIELTYLALLDTLTAKWQPASMNISCRQGMDRGPSLAVLWMLQKNQLDEKAIGPLLLGPPLLIHNRASHASRIERFSSAAKQGGWM